MGFALRGGYRLTTGSGAEAKRFTATFSYESEDFRTVGDLAGFRLENLSVNATYSQSLSQRTSFVAGANYFVRAGGRDQSTVRSEERRVGKEGVRTCNSGWAPYHNKKTANRRAKI